MTTIDVPVTAGRDKAARRRTWLARSAILFILGPALLYALYLILLAPAQFQTNTAFAVRGAEAAPIDALGALGIAPPSANTLDARIVEEYIRSNAMVEGLRERYGFEEAYSRFSLDPFSFLPANADHETATRFWRGKVRVMHDAASQSATVEVSAFTPEDSLRLLDEPPAPVLRPTLHPVASQGMHRLGGEAEVAHDGDPGSHDGGDGVRECG